MRSRHPSFVRAVAFGAVAGVLVAIPIMSILAAVSALCHVGFVPALWFDAVTRVLPGRFVTRGIDAMIATLTALGIGPIARAAKLVEMTAALASFAALCAVAGALVAVLVARSSTTQHRESTESRRIEPGRRALLALVSVAGAAVSLDLVWLLLSRATGSSARARTRSSIEVRDSLFVAAPGTRDEITPSDKFYRVDIDLLPPRIDARRWRLALSSSSTTSSSSFSLADLRALPLVDQIATLECISNPVGGDLISTGIFTGVPLASLLARAHIDDDQVRAIAFTCADGYKESLPLASAVDPRTLLVVALDNAPLAAEHGAPLRLYTPDRFGMKNPKWLTHIAALPVDVDGYWEERGWDKPALVRTTSVIDTKGRLARTDGVVALGGIAFAGARGISRVDVRIDDEPWRPAQLKRPLSPLAWTLWRCDLATPAGRHRAAVRAFDARGVPQDEVDLEPHPSGASGLHVVEIEV